MLSQPKIDFSANTNVNNETKTKNDEKLTSKSRQPYNNLKSGEEIYQLKTAYMIKAMERFEEKAILPNE